MSGDLPPATAKQAGAAFVLGTAQLGSRYGVSNVETPDRQKGIALVRTALRSGVSYLDTAGAYGDSETIIGDALAGMPDASCDVITKVSPLSGVPGNEAPRRVRDLTEQSLNRSMDALRLTALGTVLLHRADHIRAWDGAVLDTLKAWRNDGNIRRIGVSVQSAQELELALELDDIGHIQLPCNVLDHRWDPHINALRHARKTRDLAVHIRSVFLQGLLISPLAHHWQRAHVPDPHSVRLWLQSLCDAHSKSDIAALCISWARGLDWVSGIVIGCDNAEHLASNLAMFEGLPLSREVLVQISASRPQMDEKTLNPATWTS